MSWQKRARFGVAVFGIASAGVVYSAIGQRQAAAPPTQVKRSDPKAILESTAGLQKQVRGDKEDYTISFERQLTYENGRTVLSGVRIAVQQHAGRDFDVTAHEAEAGQDQRELRLNGDVKLAASDGFQLTTDQAQFNQGDGIVRAAGKVSFLKGGMTGYGTGTMYDQKADVLTMASDAHVEMRDAKGAVTLNFDAAAATLDRTQDLLTLTGNVRVLRGEQTIEADRAVAHMDAEDQYITFLQLRGNARVQGAGGSLEAMRARDIDLDYGDDGQTLDHAVLTGSAAIALTAQNGAPGRSVAGESIDLQLAADGSVAATTAREKVRLVLPATEGAPARTIQAKALDATGQEKNGLTDARFTDDVEFREQLPKGSAMRVVRSKALRIALTDTSVGAAVFTGSVRFEEPPLVASAAEVQYAPEAGTLQLSGVDAGGGPHVEDEQVSIDAQTISIALDGRKMAAVGNVKSTLRPRATNGRLPGLLKQDQPANVNAAALDYEGAAGRAVYTGDAALWQGQTSVRAATIAVDQQSGDLIATGTARATIPLETGTSIGRAHEIRYEDARHVITYSPSAEAAMQPQLSGPQGDLRADRVEAVLVATGGALDRLEAYTNVTMQVDPGTASRRTATGARLTYRAATEQYDITGTAAVPVKVIEACREITGKTLTFYRSTDRITVDGHNEIRTETKSGGACPPSSPRPAARP